MSAQGFRFISTFLAAMLPVALAGVGPAVAAPADTTSVVFTARDYGFDGPDRIPAGVSTIRIVNQGQDLHHIQVLKLLQGKTAADFRSAVAKDSVHLPTWVKFVGGPNAIVPGGDTAATMTLTSGEYLLVCLIPDKTGVPHFVKGMQKAISVTGGKPSVVSEPKASVTITQADFRFGLSRPIQAGSHTIEVMNHGTQPHEVVLVKLAPGATAKEFIAAFEPGASGPPPGMPLGGIVGLESGEHGFFTATFEPGQYAMICFMPETTTGAPHFTRGMTAEFTVK